MPNRWIRESCRTSKNLAQLSDRAERVFWRLTTCADDFGRFLADPEVVKAVCFPYRREYKLNYVMSDLKELVIHKLCTLYEVKDRLYGVFHTWEHHQGKPRALRSKYPDIPHESQNLHTDVSHLQTNVRVCASGPDSDSDSDQRESSSSLIPNGKGKSERKGATAFPLDWKLSEEEADGWKKFAINPFVEFAAFKDHALSNDRRQHDWKAAFRNWCRKSIANKENRYGRLRPLQQ